VSIITRNLRTNEERTEIQKTKNLKEEPPGNKETKQKTIPSKSEKEKISSYILSLQTLHSADLRKTRK